jgi:hypothetical protein
VQEKARHRLVDALLDCARLVVHGDAQLAKCMQEIEAQHDLLERAARHAAHEDAFRQATFEPRHDDPVDACRQIDRASGKRDVARFDAPPPEGAAQLRSMPPRRFRHDGDARRRARPSPRCSAHALGLSNDAASSSGAT